MRWELAASRSRGAIVLLVLLSAALPGCRPVSSDDAEPTTLRVLMTDDWGDTPAFLAAVRDFEQSHEGVRVEVNLESIRNMARLVKSQVQAGNPVDVAQWHAFAAGSAGFAEPLDDLWAEHGLSEEEFFEGAMADVTWDGRKYGVPLDTNALILLLRDRSFEAAGLGEIEELDSFGHLEEVAGRLTSSDGSRRALAIPTSGWRTFGWIRANGGNLLELTEDGNARFTIDSPEVVEALAFLSSLINRGVAFAPVGASSTADSLALFRSGAAAMYTSGSWDFSVLDEQMPDSDFTVAPMPGGVDGTSQGSAMGGSSLFVPKGASNRQLAFEFMDMLTSDPYALRLAKEEGRLPTRVAIYEDEFFQDDRFEVVREQLETAQPLLLEAFPEAFEAYVGAVNSILSGDVDADEALSKAQTTAEQSQ
ncbi:MAG: extracellular solute-binding protein [Actinobacteria bacterium]|nr:extracellular solute-binding protein [Actinomycetota bacterium]